MTRKCQFNGPGRLTRLPGGLGFSPRRPKVKSGGLAMLRLLVLCVAISAAADDFHTTALSTARQIMSEIKPNGWTMNSTDAAPLDHPYLKSSLYYGAPGIAILMRQIVDSVERSKGSSGTSIDRESETLAWTDATTRTLDVTLRGIDADKAAYGSNTGLYYGLAGIAFGLREGSRALGAVNVTKYLRGSHELEERIQSGA